MCGWEGSGCWRGYCKGNQRSSARSPQVYVLEGRLVGWFVYISRECLFDSHVHCLLVLLLLFAFGSSHG